ncbi:DUF6264 family protein [Agromyces sp. MMS24-K17]|uniref:DUF6264 family protein n=1 Tax=Agromyces sp. MMS24-K17 TaxID=3372850 RepID=UPI003754298E
MTQDEAARTPGSPAPAGDGPGAAATPAPAPADERSRPRPKYGEYAPPGWTWQPPTDDRDEASGPAASAASPAPTAAAQPQSHPGPAPAAAPGLPAEAGAEAAPARPERPVDRIATIGLLAFGAFGAWNTATSYQLLPQSFQVVYEQQGVGDFVAPEWLPTLTTVGIIVQLALYAAVLGWSVLRIRRRKVAFWVPIAGGLLSVVLTLVLCGIVFFNDPTFLAYVEQMSGTAP